MLVENRALAKNFHDLIFVLFSTNFTSLINKYLMNFKQSPDSDFFIVFLNNSLNPELKESFGDETIELCNLSIIAGKGEWKKAKMEEVTKNIQSWNILSL